MEHKNIFKALVTKGRTYMSHEASICSILNIGKEDSDGDYLLPLRAATLFKRNFRGKGINSFALLTFDMSH
ncbi:MAG: hypothetical protein KF860_14740 [Cyclobacteriaceae bacterium]|nr:hypothetical protein [Cyclobacteriaceae bacterium]